MNPTVKKRIDLQVALKQIGKHKGTTASFLTREENSQDLLGKFHKDTTIWIRARRRVLQCIAQQFPCDLQLKILGILKKVKCSFMQEVLPREERLHRKCRTHTMLLTRFTKATHRHTPRNMERIDVLH